MAEREILLHFPAVCQVAGSNGGKIFLPANVMGISEHLDTALQRNIKNLQSL